MSKRRHWCILTSAMPDTPLIDEVYGLHAKAHAFFWPRKTEGPSQGPS